MNAARIIANLFAAAKRHGQLVECFHEQRLSVTDDGTPQYGTPTPFDAMWLAEQERVRDVTGETVTATGKLWVPAQYPITAQDRITLPDGTMPTVIAVNAHASGQSFTHYEVFF